MEFLENYVRSEIIPQLANVPAAIAENGSDEDAPF
jgi:hypothetical protein